jgi:hypothetical protein
VRALPQLEFRDRYRASVRRKILMGKADGLLGKVVGRLEIAAEEPYFAVYVPFQQNLATV